MSLSLLGKRCLQDTPLVLGEGQKKGALEFHKSALVGRKAEDDLLLRDAQRGHAIVCAENHIVHA